MRHRRTAVLGFAVLAAALSSACDRQPSQSTSPSAPGPDAGARAVPAAAASPADDGNWTMPGKDYASTRFSALNEITPANVGKLQVALTFSTGTTDGFEAPPLVVEGKVLVGTPGGERGARGRLPARDAGSGKIAGIGYTTGPDKDVLIGPGYRPPYPMDSGKDLGVHTWPGELWKIGGGTVWGWLSYDPQLKLVYYGASNPGPWNQEQRPGDNKFTSGVFARHVATGQARWFYQSNPHDLYDHDDINEIILVDMPAASGGRIPALIRPDRN